MHKYPGIMNSQIDTLCQGTYIPAHIEYVNIQYPDT